MTSPNVLILPIAIDAGYENEILLESVSRFVISLNSPEFYSHMVNDHSLNIFILSTDLNIYYIFIRMLYIEDIYEDGKYVFVDLKNLKEFFDSAKTLNIPLNMRAETALAEIDPDDPGLHFDKCFITKDFLDLIKPEDLEDFNELSDEYQIVVISKADELFK